MLYRCLRCGSTLVRPNKKEPHLSDTIRKIWIPLDKWDLHSKVAQSLHINLFQRSSIVAMEPHEAAFDAGEVERLVILVVVILGAEVLIPVAGHILLEESYKVFEEFEAGGDELDFISRYRMLNPSIINELRGTWFKCGSIFSVITST